MPRFMCAGMTRIKPIGSERVVNAHGLGRDVRGVNLVGAARRKRSVVSIQRKIVSRLLCRRRRGNRRPFPVDRLN
jgi:hypothetical protein